MEGTGYSGGMCAFASCLYIAECQAVGIKGYPTWILEGKQYPGERSLDQLEDMLAGKAEVGEPPN